MPEGVIVTTTANTVRVDFNDLAAAAGTDKAIIHKKQVISITKSGDFVEVFMLEIPKWTVTNILHPKFIKVKSVDGVAPTSLSHLFDLLAEKLD